MKLTPWYPGTVKPVRGGVCGGGGQFGIRYCYWTGKWWFMCESTAKLASTGQIISGFDRLPWRGLTERAAIGGEKP